MGRHNKRPPEDARRPLGLGPSYSLLARRQIDRVRFLGRDYQAVGRHNKRPPEDARRPLGPGRSYSLLARR